MESDSTLEAARPLGASVSPELALALACAFVALALAIACALLWRSRARLSRDLARARAAARHARAERDSSLENESRLARVGLLQRVAAGLAFDLNNPLAVIQGAALILRARLEKAARPRGEPIAAADLLRECERVERAVAKVASTVRLYRDVPALARSFEGASSSEPALAAPGALEALVESRAQFHGVTLVRLEPAAASGGVSVGPSASGPASPGLSASGGAAHGSAIQAAPGVAGPSIPAGVASGAAPQSPSPFSGLLRASVLCLCESIFETLARGPRDRRFTTLTVRRSRDASEIEISHKVMDSGAASLTAVGRLAPALAAIEGLDLVVDERAGERRYLVRAKPGPGS